MVAQGCGFAAKQAASTARGGHGHYLTIVPVYNLQEYQSVSFVPFTNSIGDNLSADLLKEVNDRVTNELMESGIKPTGGKSLELTGTVIHLDDGVLQNQIVVQVDLRDIQTGRSVGRAKVEGEVEGARGLKAAAQGVAYGVLKLLADNHFPVTREPRVYQ